MGFLASFGLCRLLLSVCVVIGATSAFAQSGLAQSGTPQTGTLQQPAKPQVDKPATPPVAAPRQPVVRQGGTASTGPAPTAAPTPPAPRPASPRAAAEALPLPPPPPPPPPEAGTVSSTGDGAVPLAPGDKKEQSTGKVPRFAALRTDEVNLRRGPGTRYPIEWVYRRRDLPVEIEREFEVWRLVRDHEGTRGWIHQATLTGRRTFLITNPEASVRKDPKDTAQAVAILKLGVIGRVRSCDAGSDWCQIQAGSYRGYLRRNQIWGVLPGEVVAP